MVCCRVLWSYRLFVKLSQTQGCCSVLGGQAGPEGCRWEQVTICSPSGLTVALFQVASWSPARSGPSVSGRGGTARGRPEWASTAATPTTATPRVRLPEPPAPAATSPSSSSHCSGTPCWSWHEEREKIKRESWSNNSAFLARDDNIS